MAPSADPALAGKRLYLFASNSQPLYAQNILNVIAAPAGAVATMRYGKDWLDVDAAAHWERMTGLPVLIHFSFQHRAEYFPATYFPVRMGHVVAGTREGDYHFVDVRLGEDVSLHWEPDDVPHSQRDSVAFLPALAVYRDQVTGLGIGAPYKGAASIAADLFDVEHRAVDRGLGAVEHFRRNAEFLIRTPSFESATFVRVLRVVAVDGRAEVAPDAARDGRPRYRLEGGKLYDVELFSYQPHGVRHAIDFGVSVGDDNTLRVVGHMGFAVASPYDRPRITVQAGRPALGQKLVAPLAIRPPAGVMGPSVSMMFDVRPATKDKALNLIAPLAVLVPLAAATIVTDTTAKVLLAGIGVILALALQWFGVSVAALITPTTAAIRPAPEAGASPAAPPPPSSRQPA